MVTNFSTSSALRPGHWDNDGDLGIGDVGEGLDGHIAEGDHAVDDQQEGSEKNEILVFQGKRE